MTTKFSAELQLKLKKLMYRHVFHGAEQGYKINYIPKGKENAIRKQRGS